MPYGYDPAEYRPDFGFIAKAGQEIGSAVDKGMEQHKQNQEDSLNQQLYNEIKQHAQTLDPKLREQIGFTDDTIRSPSKGESHQEYAKWATEYAHNMLTKADEAQRQQLVKSSSQKLAGDVQTLETTGAPPIAGTAEAVQTGRDIGQGENAMKDTTFGPQPERQAMLSMPKPPEDLTKPPEQIESETATAPRPVTSIELSDAAKARGADMKSEIETREKREERESQEKRAGERTQAQEDIADKKIAAAKEQSDKKIAAQQKMWEIKQPYLYKKLAIDAHAKTAKNQNDYDKLVIEYQKLAADVIKNKASYINNSDKMGLNPEDAQSLGGELDSIINEANENARKYAETTKVLKSGQQPPQTGDKFVPGKKYKDANGNIATYLGGGKWSQQ